MPPAGRALLPLPPGGRTAATIAVVIPSYNHARFLAGAIDSVLAQTLPAAEIIAVDDASTDDTVAVAARYPAVRLLRQPVNRGLSAARNLGAASANSRFVLFLDADDRLLPGALARSAACMAMHPGAAFVYGAHRRVDDALRPISGAIHIPVGPRPFEDFLHTNVVGMIAAALFDRSILIAAGGFDPSLSACEDYDLFLRLARDHPVGCHSDPVAEYRIHDGAMSADMAQMARAARAVLDRHRPARGQRAAWRRYRRGRRAWAALYAHGAWRQRPGRTLSSLLDERWRMTQLSPVASLFAAATQAAKRLLPERWTQRLRLMANGKPMVGRVDLGDLGRLGPISSHFGEERGTPIDRFYIERFYERHSADIAGRVLEVGDESYSRRFGGARITRQDVLHVKEGNRHATIVGDLSQPGLLPEAAFDCMIVAQTLMLLYDMPAAAAELKRALKPGGILLLTVPGVTTVDRYEWRDRWYWSLTEHSVRRMFGELFGPENFTMSQDGNAFSATCFLQGLALEEIDRRWLDPADPAFPVTIGVRARRVD